MGDGSQSLLSVAAPFAVELFSELFGETPSEPNANPIRWRVKRSLVYFPDTRCFFDHKTRETVLFLDMIVRVGAAHSHEDAETFLLGWLRARGAIDKPAGPKGAACEDCMAPLRYVREYIYRDEYSEEKFKKTRKECSRRPECKGKRFAWYRRGAGEWIAGLGDQTPPPFRLDEWFCSSIDTINILEGEKCADALRLFSGKLATSINKWTPENAAYFRGFHVVIWPDAGEAGISQYEQARDALSGIAASISCATAIDAFPDMDEKVAALRRLYDGEEDFADFVEKRISMQELYRTREHGYW